MTDKKLKELLAVIDNRYGRVRSKEECIIEIKTCVQAFGIAYVKDYDAKSKTNQQLEVYAPVTSKAEAKELAAKKLRLYNKYERQMSFTYPGDPGKVAGLTFNADQFGPWDGKYIVKQSKHTVSGSGGYTTQVTGRHTLGGY